MDETPEYLPMQPGVATVPPRRAGTGKAKAPAPSPPASHNGPPGAPPDGTAYPRRQLSSAASATSGDSYMNPVSVAAAGEAEEHDLMLQAAVDTGEDADYTDATSHQPDDTTASATYYNVAPVDKLKKHKYGGASIKLPTKKVRKARVPTTSKPWKFDDLDPEELQYSVDDDPPWYLCGFLGFQHYLIMFGATVSNVMVLAPALCIAADDHRTKAELIGTIFVCSGIATTLQTFLGVRLPIVQGGTFNFVTPSFAILNLPQFKCNESLLQDHSMSNMTMIDHGYNDTMRNTEWMPRIRALQGAIMVASLFQVLIGFTGLVGLLLRFIGPLAVAPTIALAGLALFDVASAYASKQWWIALVTVVLIIAFSQYSKNVQVPCFTFRRGEGCHKMGFPVFRLFPVVLSIGLVWTICAILTAAGVFPDDISGGWSGANTNQKIQLLQDAPWIRFPYPGQWGAPTVSTAAVFGMLAGVLANLIESVGDYYACARISGVPPPPVHAVNRGIGMEGIACILCGAFGSASGTTSYSENIGAIGITKVASRRVFYVAATFMIVFGIVNKIGTFFVTIPEPIVGGVFIVMFGMVCAVGISNLQFVNLNSSRNLFIIGFSFFFGLSLPKYISTTPGVISVGNESIDQIFTVLLSTSMFVGGFAGFILDNTIPGSDDERGLVKWRQHLMAKKKTRKRQKGAPPGPDGQALYATEYSSLLKIYEIPRLTGWLEKHSWSKFIPFLHTFDEKLFVIKKARRKAKKKHKDDDIEEDDENLENNVSQV